jgi:hypothetical protein
MVRRMSMKSSPAAPPHTLPLRKKVLFTLMVTAAALVLGLAAAEVLVRLTSPGGYVTPEILKGRNLQYSPALFARHVFPQREVRALIKEVDNKIEYYINERGYRGRAFSVPKPGGVIRIMIYGGSAAFDINLPEGQDWPHRIETILRQRGYPEVEVINAGTPGHASFDSFGRFFSEGHLFEPDYVISYNEWNDIKYFRSDRPLLREFKPFCLADDPRLNYRNGFDRFLCEHSQFYVRLRWRYYSWRLGVKSQGAVPRGPYASEITGTALKQYYLTQVMFVESARAAGAVPILMTEARLTTADNTESQRARIEYDYVKLDHEMLVRAYEEVERRLHKISAEKGVELIDVARDLNGRDEFFADVVHLTPAGSEALAQGTAQRLIEILEARRGRK